MVRTILGIFSESQSDLRKTFRSDYFPTKITMGSMAYDPNKVRAALRSFLSSTGLKEFPLEQAAEVGAGTIRAFLGARTRAMTDETWNKLASAATKKTGRLVTAAELRGENRPLTVPISSRIGAGERVFPIEGDAPLGYVDLPRGVDAAEAWQVEGDSMRPLYGPKDLLFPSAKRRPPEQLINRIVGAQIVDGQRVVKLLMRGTRKGRWNLVSVNPFHPPLADQQLEWVAKIAAAIYVD
jgi:phage repressor protein C with HTH and peptisase S24 domain